MFSTPLKELAAPVLSLSYLHALGAEIWRREGWRGRSAFKILAGIPIALPGTAHFALPGPIRNPFTPAPVSGPDALIHGRILLMATGVVGAMMMMPPAAPSQALVRTDETQKGGGGAMLSLRLPPLSTTRRFENPELAPPGGGTIKGSIPTPTGTLEPAPDLLRITGSVGNGIFMAAVRAGAPPQAVQTYLRAIAPRITAGEIDPDARFDLIIAPSRAGDPKGGALLYAGLSQSDGALRMIRWTINGQSEWHDLAAVASSGGGFSAPVIGRRTSGFGLRRHPLLGYNRLHKGTDFGAPSGAPVRAVADGVVKLAGWAGGYGRMVRLGHEQGLGSGYAHLSRIEVTPGSRVRRGQIIGRVGSTGLSTGPHLHFEVYRRGVAVDPRTVQFASRPMLSGQTLSAFRARIAALTALPITRDADKGAATVLWGTP